MKRALILAAVFLLASQMAYAGQVAARYDSRTGDKELDVSLGKVNVEANADRNNFIKKLSVSYNTPEKNIEVLFSREQMQPADVYMTLKVARIANRPIETVVREYRVNQGRGWGVIAKNLGIKPGSKEFHALKRDDSGMLGQQGGNAGKGKGHGHGKGRGRDKD